MPIALAAAALLAASDFTIAFGGDVMLYRIAPESRPLRYVADTFRKADVAIVNLEIPLTQATARTPLKSAADIAARRQFVLKAHPRHIGSLKGAGIDLVSLANNHAMDYGAPGLKETIGLLNKAQIGHAGAGANWEQANRVAVYQTLGGVRVGVISALAFMGRGALKTCAPASTNGWGINVLAFDGQITPAARIRLKRWIQNARAQCDFLIVAPHWGIERQTQPTAYQRMLAKALIDAGADVVFAHHPHVLQPIEMYKGRTIMYSTGNLISPTPARSGIVILTVSKEKQTPHLLQTQIANGQVKFVR